MIALGGTWLSRKEENTTVGTGIYAKGNIHTTLVSLKAQITVPISPFVVKHCSKSLVFLVLRLQLLSWLFHCSVSTLLHVFCRWVFSWLYCQCIMALGISTLVPLHLMGKCFKQLQLGYCIFVGPNCFLVHKNHDKKKMHSGSVWFAMSIKGTYICSHSRKNISVSWELYFASVITATMSYQEQSTGFSIIFWTFQDVFWLEILIPNLVLVCSRTCWSVMISVRINSENPIY